MSEKPTPDDEVLHEIADLFRNHPHDKFVAELFWWSTGLLDQSEIPHAAVAFEMLESTFSAFENGLTHRDIAAAYPVRAWREDTVEIPRAWIRELAARWTKYKSAPKGSSFGEAFEVEGGGQGKRPIREILERRSGTLKLSNMVIVEYLAERADGGIGSWQRACEQVALKAGVSVDTVQRALANHRSRTLTNAKQAGLTIERGKTS